MTPSGGLLPAKVVMGEAAILEESGGGDAYLWASGAMDYSVDDDVYVSCTACDTAVISLAVVEILRSAWVFWLFVYDADDSSGTALFDMCMLHDACEATVCTADVSEPIEPKVEPGIIPAIGPVYTEGYLAGTTVNNGTSPVELV